MRIAVDAMGGDYAPREIVAGTIDAARRYPDIEKLILVGDRPLLEKEISSHSRVPDKILIEHTTQVVGMDESPASAIRRKKDSSIGRAVDLVKQGEASAVFSAGNTGAAVAASTLKLRTLDGIIRPAIATVIPNPIHFFVLIDAGANLDCNPKMISQFAVMGEIYAREILRIENPRVGLLSIGEEDAKGNDATKQAFKILSASSLNFIGNVESRDLFEGRVDVVACDGFVGNVVLKTSEAVASAMGRFLKSAFTSSLWRKAGAAMLTGAFHDIRQQTNPEAQGGAHLLGIRGTCVIGHGSSSSFAVRNGIRVAMESVNHHLNHLIIDGARSLG